MRAVFIAWICLAGSVAAAEASPPWLAYDAPPACPAREELEAQIQRRTSEASAWARAKPLAVAVHAVGGAYSGTLRRDARELRTLTAPVCSDLVEALALVAALAIVADEEPTSAGPGPGARDPAPAPSPAPLPGKRLQTAGWAVTGLGLLATTAMIAGGIVSVEGSCHDVLGGFGSCDQLAGNYTLIIAGGAAALELSAGIAMLVIGKRREKRARAARDSQFSRSR